MLDPVPLHKNGTMRKIPAIDASAWMLSGWKLEPENANKDAVDEITLVSSTEGKGADLKGIEIPTVVDVAQATNETTESDAAQAANIEEITKSKRKKEDANSTTGNSVQQS